MNNKKKILVIILLILLGLGAVLLTRTDGEKIEDTTLTEYENVVDNAEDLEETTEDSEKLQETGEEETETGKETKEEGRQENAAEDSFVKTEETSEQTEQNFGQKEDASEKQDSPMKNEHTTLHVSSIKVCEIGNYIGGYVEDGSDEFVNNVMMVVLENVGNEYIQLANIKINDKYLFEVTTLFPGEKVMVLEKNRAEYVEGVKVVSTEIFDVALFDEIPTMCEEILKIEAKDGMISVENISGKEFPGGKVFFKTVLEDTYLGGITYFSSIPKLSAGETVKLSGGHYEEGRSEMLFVTHAE